MPKVVKLVGPSGVGKTTLVEALLRLLRRRGLVVGYVKHAAHGFQLDRPGKDSARATAAGARGVALVGPGGLAYLEAGAAPTPEQAARRFFAHADLVLVEGFSRSTAPTLVLHPADGSRRRAPPKQAPKGRVLAHLDATQIDARVVADLLVGALDLPVRTRRARRRRTR